MVRRELARLDVEQFPARRRRPLELLGSCQGFHQLAVAKERFLVVRAELRAAAGQPVLEQRDGFVQPPGIAVVHRQVESRADGFWMVLAQSGLSPSQRLFKQWDGLIELPL